MKNLSYAQICQLFAECHSPSEAAETNAMRWAKRMEWMLGPDDCKFLIRGDDMYLMGDTFNWISSPSAAKRFTWAEAAVRITNNPRLEAIRIGQDNIAMDSKGRMIALFGKGKDKDG